MQVWLSSRHNLLAASTAPVLFPSPSPPHPSLSLSLSLSLSRSPSYLFVTLPLSLSLSLSLSGAPSPGLPVGKSSAPLLHRSGFLHRRATSTVIAVLGYVPVANVSKTHALVIQKNHIQV